MAIGCVQVLGTPIRTQIAIPISTGLGDTFHNLIVASFVARGMLLVDAEALIVRMNAFKIVAPSLGMTVAKPPPTVALNEASFATHGQVVSAGADYYEPADADDESYVRSAGAAFNAIAVCYF